MRAALDARRERAADRLDLGKLGHRRRRIGASDEAAARSAPGRVTPAHHISGARADVRHRPVVARRPPSPGCQASSGTFSRVWSLWPIAEVDAVVGRSGQQVALAQRPRSSRRRPRRSPAARGGSPRRPCDGRRAGRSRSGSRRRFPRSSSPSSALIAASACAFDAPACESIEAAPREQVGDLADAVHRRPPPRCAAIQVRGVRRRAASSRGARPCARTPPAAPANGRAMTRPTAYGPVSAARARSHASWSVRARHHVLVRGELDDRVDRRVEDHLARPQVVLAETAGSPRSRRSPRRRRTAARSPPRAATTSSGGSPSGERRLRSFA